MLPELLLSGGCENLATTMDIFSRYLFAYPTKIQDATTIVKIVIIIMSKHGYLLTAIISDKGSSFVSQVIKEKAQMVGSTLQHTITKHA